MQVKELMAKFPIETEFVFYENKKAIEKDNISERIVDDWIVCSDYSVVIYLKEEK